MKYLDLTFPTPGENLACDEVLLDRVEEGLEGDILRIWKPSQSFIVLGYANRVRAEADIDACHELGIPILRRCSGGGSVLQGPECLNYSLILRISGHRAWGGITSTNCEIMQRHRRALEEVLNRPVSIEGSTDLAMDRLKFSGNAQRRRAKALLFHGTFLLGVNFELMEKVLRFPQRIPAYRENRSHRQFLTRVNITEQQIVKALRRAWDAEPVLRIQVDQAVQDLVRTRYSREDWKFRF